MSGLDEKLRGIDVSVGGQLGNLDSGAIKEIKEAFIEDGWQRCINPKGHAHWLETDSVSENIHPDTKPLINSSDFYDAKMAKWIPTVSERK